MDIFLRIQTKFKYLDSFSQIKKKISHLSIMYVVFSLLTFQSGNLPRSVAYVENPSPACPWKNIKQNIQPYSPNSNYATI